MKLFEGLLGYEALLMALGALLFIVLVGIMLFYVVKERPIKPLLAFFALPVLMIGFPGIEKVKFGDSVELVTKSLEVLEANPDDTEARAALQSEIQAIEGRVLTAQTKRLVLEAKAVLQKPSESKTPGTLKPAVTPLKVKPLTGTLTPVRPSTQP